jgi:hypothetical protein
MLEECYLVWSMKPSINPKLIHLKLRLIEIDKSSNSYFIGNHFTGKETFDRNVICADRFWPLFI